MDWAEHIKQLAGGSYAIFEGASEETERALKSVVGFLEADIAAASTEMWQEGQKGAANLERIGHLGAIKVYAKDLIERLGAIHLVDHFHDIEYNDDDGYYGPDRAGILDMAPHETGFVPPTNEDELVDMLRTIGGGDVVLTAEDIHIPISKSQVKRLEAQGVTFANPEREKVLPDDTDPGLGRRDIEPDNNVVALAQGGAPVNPSKQSRAGDTLAVNIGEGTVKVETPGD